MQHFDYNYNKLTLKDQGYPTELQTIASPPKELYITGQELASLLKRPRIAIVGSRSISPYGKQVTRELAKRLAERGVIIVSGLALGVDKVAHQAALEAGGTAIAVLPSSFDAIVPFSNMPLAHEIIRSGGALVTEYGPGHPTYRQHFIARNRIVAGLAQAVLITEAAEKSGSLHTARFALEQGKDVLAVPGNITSRVSVGTNNLIKSGATPVTSYEDVLAALRLDLNTAKAEAPRGRTADEQLILSALWDGVSEGQALLTASGLPLTAFNRAMTMLEIGGRIRALGGNFWTLA